MKKKLLLPILSVCMVVALVSVGFAAWLITGNDTNEAEGQFVTYNVENNYFKVTATEKNSGKITFGKSNETFTPGTSGTWLSVDEVADQVLEKTFTITITPEVAFDSSSSRDVTTLLSTDVVKVTLSGLGKSETAETDDTTAKKYAAAVQNGIITNPTVESGDIKSSSGDLSDGVVISLPATSFTVQTSDYKTATAEVTVKFYWGTNGNPYTYYNTLENSDTNRKAAYDGLKLVEALNNATYYIYLDVVEGS